MAIGRRDSSLRHLGMLFTAGAVGQCTDAELLERFARRDSEGAELAFSTLVDRHGPMVLRVCRRLLDDPNDAEDAFQATFLVLLRRAGRRPAQPPGDRVESCRDHSPNTVWSWGI